MAISPLSTLTKTYFIETISTIVSEACHTLISGGNNIQKIYLPVKVSIPDGNFDFLVNFVLPIL
jgi:hypothetical protein